MKQLKECLELRCRIREVDESMEEIKGLGGLVRPLVHVRRLHGRVLQPTLPKICGLTCADIIAEYFGNFNGFVVDPHAQSAELQYMLGK